MNLKYCKDCRHFIETDCHHPTNTVNDLVNGGYRYRLSPHGMRQAEEYCGASGKLFKEYHVTPPAPNATGTEDIIP